MADTTSLILERAYFLWEDAGRPHGREHEFWAQAVLEMEETRLPRHENAHGMPVPPDAPAAKAPRVRKAKVGKDAIADAGP